MRILGWIVLAFAVLFPVGIFTGECAPCMQRLGTYCIGMTVMSAFANRFSVTAAYPSLSNSCPGSAVRQGDGLVP